jgi:hypothetical protein
MENLQIETPAIANPGNAPLTLDRRRILSAASVLGLYAAIHPVGAMAQTTPKKGGT